MARTIKDGKRIQTMAAVAAMLFSMLPAVLASAQGLAQTPTQTLISLLREYADTPSGDLVLTVPAEIGTITLDVREKEKMLIIELEDLPEEPPKPSNNAIAPVITVTLRISGSLDGTLLSIVVVSNASNVPLPTLDAQERQDRFDATIEGLIQDFTRELEKRRRKQSSVPARIIAPATCFPAPPLPRFSPG